MIILFALAGAVMLLIGLTEVWSGRWRTLWMALAYAALFAIACVTAELWFPLFGMNRGDGFILIGYMIFGGAVFVATVVALILAPLVAALGRRRANQLLKD